MPSTHHVGPFYTAADPGQVNGRSTARLTQDTAPSQLPKTQPFIGNTSTITWRVVVSIGGSEVFDLDLTEEAIVGRPDDVEMHAPEVDLSDFGARDRGVSRRHARIAALNDKLYLCDLGSTNGTRLNGKQLVANHLYLLNNGDTVECGSLLMTLHFMRTAR